MPAASRPRARRLSREARRQSIAEAAVDLILDMGHSSCSLEQVAERAGISKALIYKYYPRREELIADLLDREFKSLRGRGLDSIPENVPIEQVVRSTVERALRYYHEHGPILRLLASDPAVAEMAAAGKRSSRSRTTDYFVRRFMKRYRVPRDVALIAVTMVVNAPIHSMVFLRRQEIDIDRTIDVWTEFIVGGWQALHKRFGAPIRPGT